MNPEKSKEQENFEREVRWYVDRGHKFDIKYVIICNDIFKKYLSALQSQVDYKQYKTFSWTSGTRKMAINELMEFVIPLDEDKSIPQLRKGLKVRIKSRKRFDEDDLWNLNNDLCMMKAYIEEVKRREVLKQIEKENNPQDQTSSPKNKSFKHLLKKFFTLPSSTALASKGKTKEGYLLLEQEDQKDF